MKRIAAYFIGLLTFAIFANAAHAAPSADLWPRWEAHKAAATESIDHTIWNDLLNRYVVEDQSKFNRFSYKAFSNGDRQQLRQYLGDLSNTKISDYSRDQQRAYWINMYNALTVYVTLEHYPIKSIRDISSGLFSSGPWGMKLIKVEGEALTLDDIEHRILRPIWKDPRIHYAVNCASIGCPNLQREAFTAGNTDEMLEKAATDFINHPRAASVSSTGKLRVSSIYVWFADDFGGEKGVIKHLKQYAKPELRTALNTIDSIDDDHYDWDLNGLAPVEEDTRPRIGS